MLTNLRSQFKVGGYVEPKVYDHLWEQVRVAVKAVHEEVSEPLQTPVVEQVRGRLYYQTQEQVDKDFKHAYRGYPRATY